MRHTIQEEAQELYSIADHSYKKHFDRLEGAKRDSISGLERRRYRSRRDLQGSDL